MQQWWCCVSFVEYGTGIRTVSSTVIHFATLLYGLIYFFSCTLYLYIVYNYLFIIDYFFAPWAATAAAPAAAASGSK